jgi:hypothetical protein
MVEEKDNPFALNPSDEILIRTSGFKASGSFPSLKGKLPPWRRYAPLVALADYSSTLFILGKLLRRARTSPNKFLTIKEHLPEILEKIHFKVKENVPEGVLREWSKYSKREIAVRLVAYIHGLKHDAFRKHLTTARKEHPELDKLWRKNGMEMNEVK